jgi:hypothetical protein
MSRGAGDVTRISTKHACAARIRSMGAAALAGIAFRWPASASQALPNSKHAQRHFGQRASPGQAGSARGAKVWTCRSLSDDMQV